MGIIIIIHYEEVLYSFYGFHSSGHIITARGDFDDLENIFDLKSFADTPKTIGKSKIKSYSKIFSQKNGQKPTIHENHYEKIAENKGENGGTKEFSVKKTIHQESDKP